MALGSSGRPAPQTRGVVGEPVQHRAHAQRQVGLARRSGAGSRGRAEVALDGAHGVHLDRSQARDRGVAIRHVGDVLADRLEARQAGHRVGDVLVDVGPVAAGLLHRRVGRRVGLDVEQLAAHRHVGPAAAQRLRRVREGLVVEVAAVGEEHRSGVGVALEPRRRIHARVVGRHEGDVVELHGLEGERERGGRPSREGQHEVVRRVEVGMRLAERLAEAVHEPEDLAVDRLGDHAVPAQPHGLRLAREVGRRH